MSSQSSYVPVPFNGLSQAAPQLRLLEQAEDLSNVLVDLPNGLRKRPPLTWKAKLLSSNGATSGRAFKVIDPDDGSVKHLFINRESTTTVARLYDDTFTSVSLTIASGAQTYLNGIVNPKDDLRIAQGVDYTFLIDRSLDTAIDGTDNPVRPYEALIFCKTGSYGRTYTVTITRDGGSPIVGSCHTPSGGDAGNAHWVGTDKIMNAIFESSDTFTGENGATHTNIYSDLISDGFELTLEGDVLYITHDTDDFTITVTDEQAGTAFFAAKVRINNFEDLPKKCPVSGFTIKVRPLRGDERGAYWVTYSTDDETPGIWKETYAPGSQAGVDPDTMPVALVKHSDGSWHIDTLGWGQRTVGDETTAADPLFVGQPIQDIGYAFGRLVLISRSEAYLTAADDPFRLYPITMTSAIDSDPVSLVPPSGEAQFFTVAQFEKSLVAIGRVQQCVIRSLADGSATATSVRMDDLSRFTLAPEQENLKPVTVNQKIYLPVPQSETSLYTGIHEVKIDRVSGEDFTDDLTAATPSLIPKDLDAVASLEKSYMALYGVSGGDDLWLHIFRYAENQRVQNGIFPWSLPTGWELVDITSDKTTFFIYAKPSSAAEVHVGTIDMDPNTKDDTSGARALTRWDWRQTESDVVSVTYDASTGYSTITSRVTLPSGKGYVSARHNASAQTFVEGEIAEAVSQPTSTSIVVKGDWTSPQKFWLGIQYRGSYKPTRVYPISGKDQRVLHGGRLRLQHIFVDISNAFPDITCTVTIAKRAGETSEQRSSRTYTLGNIALGFPEAYTGKWRIPIMSDTQKVSLEFIDDWHLGARISGFEWFGDFVLKGNRLT